MLKKLFTVGRRKIGENNPCFIVAEMSANHQQSIKRAYRIIDAAVKAGCDAVKLQTYTPDGLTINVKNKWFKIKHGLWKNKTLYQLYKKTYTPWHWQARLKKYGERKGIIVFSTAFDLKAVDFLEKINNPIYKVSSFEINDLELLRRIGKTKKPVIVSRGLASQDEIKEAIKTLKQAGTSVIAILHCVSSYPADLSQMNLATIPDLRRRFGVISGLSDHTLGMIASLTAVALGAKIIEKHFTLGRADGGSDSAFSVEPKEMAQLVKHIRQVEQAIGKVSYKSDEKELQNEVFKRSLFVIKDIKKGEKFTADNIRSIRPGYGLSPKFYRQVINKRAVKNIKKGTPLSWQLITE